MWKVQLFELNFDQREVAAVADVVGRCWTLLDEAAIAAEKNL